MNLNKIKPYDIIHIMLATYLDKYGMLVENHDTYKGEILNSSFEIVYQIPTKNAEFRMICMGYKNGKDEFKMYFRRLTTPWILIREGFPMTKDSSLRIEKYKMLLHKHYEESNRRSCKDYLAIMKEGKLHVEGFKKCIRIVSFNKELNRKCTIDICSDYK